MFVIQIMKVDNITLAIPCCATLANANAHSTTQPQKPKHYIAQDFTSLHAMMIMKSF
jgi:hypothetical protein